MVRVALQAWLLVAAASGVPAQADIVFSRLEVDLWPEYDRPGVLVIYRGTIAPGVALPATVMLTIPAAAGPPSAVAELQADGQLVSLPHERTVDGDVALIELVAGRPRIQLEYYDPRLERLEASRSYIWTWPGDYEVASLLVSAQQPDLARNLLLEPTAGREERGNDGLLYRILTLNGMTAGQSFDVALSYEKAVDSLSVETLLPRGGQTGGSGQSLPGPSTSGSWPDPRLLVGAAVAILLAASTLLASRLRPGAPARPGGGAGFCTECGAPAASADRFCHRCGSSLG